jgi:hypothetical protein
MSRLTDQENLSPEQLEELAREASRLLEAAAERVFAPQGGAH